MQKPDRWQIIVHDHRCLQAPCLLAILFVRASFGVSLAGEKNCPAQSLGGSSFSSQTDSSSASFGRTLLCFGFLIGQILSQRAVYTPVRSTR